MIAGDSAGGNLVAASMVTLVNMNSPSLPLPAGNVQISPWVNIDTSESVRPGKRYVDCLSQEMLHPEHHGEFFLKSDSYSSDQERKIALKNPALSPLFGSFKGLCPTLVTYGGTEIFQHDCQELIECLKRDGVKVDVITEPNAAHIWLICSLLSPTLAIWERDCSKLAEWCADQVSA